MIKNLLSMSREELISFIANNTDFEVTDTLAHCVMCTEESDFKHAFVCDTCAQIFPRPFI